MNYEDRALAEMYSPGMRRPGKKHGGVMQIHITRACDQACFGCTQGSNLKGPYSYMSVEQFVTACESLKGYFGTIGIFGGNPATHPKFEDICSVLRFHFPKSQCGIWCNNPFGKGAIMRGTFDPARSNLNVHLNSTAFTEFKHTWPESRPFGLQQDSRHSPVFVALKDVVHDEAVRWNMIASCDINKHWSAMIGVFRKELRAWFCEIAGAQSILHQNEINDNGEYTYPDTGLEVKPGWWQESMTSFREQVRKHCHECGVPLRGYGTLAQESDDKGVEYVSEMHKDIYQIKSSHKDRKVQVVETLAEVKPDSLDTFIDYLGNSNKGG